MVQILRKIHLQMTNRSFDNFSRCSVVPPVECVDSRVFCERFILELGLGHIKNVLVLHEAKDSSPFLQNYN